jgi:hypothetical protein
MQLVTLKGPFTRQGLTSAVYSSPLPLPELADSRRLEKWGCQVLGSGQLPDFDTGRHRRLPAIDQPCHPPSGLGPQVATSTTRLLQVGEARDGGNREIDRLAGAETATNPVDFMTPKRRWFGLG